MALPAAGEQNLFTEDIERLTGWKNETVRHYVTAGNRARREGTATDRDMPASVDRIRRELTKGNGKPLAVWTPVWRKTDILRWLEARGVELQE